MTLLRTEARKVVVRVPNWVGDVVLSLPAVNALRACLPHAELVVLCRPSVADLYAGQSGADRVLACEDRGLGAMREAADRVRAEGFELAVLLQNAFRAAWITWRAGIPQRVGYGTDARGFLLSQSVPLPRPGEIPSHQSFYYLELLVRLGLLERLPVEPRVGLVADPAARERVETLLTQVLAHPRQRPRVALVPGAAFGSAKRWLPDRFAALAARLVERCGAAVLLCGTAQESVLGEEIRRQVPAVGLPIVSLLGLTSLSELLGLVSTCDLVVGNDSGTAHLAAGLGIPQVTIFGSTDPHRTGPLSAQARIVRRPVSCSPCELRQCPVDHRCMTQISVDDVWEAVEAALVRSPSPVGARRPMPALRS